MPPTILPPADFIAAFKQERASAILRTNDAATARNAMNAVIEGGFTICEFTLTIPNAFSLIREFSQRPGLLIGAGTVLSPQEAHEAVSAGACFLVSPVVDEEVIDAANRLGVAVMPGCSTPTEMLKAHRAGAQLQKLFPAPGPGPIWVSQTLGPMPFLKIVPTGGVTLDNFAGYLQAGAFAVGFVNSLFDPADLAAGNFAAVSARAQTMRKAVVSHK